MTRKEIEEARKNLHEWENGVHRDLTVEEKILSKELDIRDMMISNLVYGDDYFKMCKKDWYIRNRRLFDWEELEALGVKDGMKRVKELWEEMKEDFKNKCTVHENVYTDCEGLTYNSSTWIDE